MRQRVRYVIGGSPTHREKVEANEARDMWASCASEATVQGAAGWWWICASARAISFASASAREIDAINIRQATHLAMRRAVAGLALAPTHILVDGNDPPPGLPCGATAIVKGDSASLSIAAASIVAKVLRDRMMTRLAVFHPQYEFEKHAGYATARHLAALAAHGPCRHHRMTFSPLRQASLSF